MVWQLAALMDRSHSKRGHGPFLNIHGNSRSGVRLDGHSRVSIQGTRVWRQLLFPMATIKTAAHYTAAGSVAARVFDFAPAALAR